MDRPDFERLVAMTPKEVEDFVQKWYPPTDNITVKERWGLFSTMFSDLIKIGMPEDFASDFIKRCYEVDKNVTNAPPIIKKVFFGQKDDKK